ncbi:MAG: hypothetical protein JXL67_13125 [Calditrichaeota bacterium]|nr:hypothetical protein [Calditrichota bacterium]
MDTVSVKGSVFLVDQLKLPDDNNTLLYEEQAIPDFFGEILVELEKRSG